MLVNKFFSLAYIRPPRHLITARGPFPLYSPFPMVHDDTKSKQRSSHQSSSRSRSDKKSKSDRRKSHHHHNHSKHKKHKSDDHKSKDRKHRDQDSKSSSKREHSHHHHRHHASSKRRSKRDQSSSSSESSGSASSADIRQHAAVLGVPKALMDMSIEQLEQLKEERRQRKNLAKIVETPEEKRVRRIAKKEAKERWRRERMGWDKEYLGYTNDDNPFGDHLLSESFIWKKKLQSEGLAHLPKEELQALKKKEMEKNKRELESVRRRRAEREREKEERDKELELMQRDKEAEYYKSWGQQEDNFHLEQAKLRSLIRIADGRAKPIDLLAKYITDQDESAMEAANFDLSGAVEVLEPTQFLVGLSCDDLEDLLEDIKVVYMQLEKGRNADYWRDVTTVVEDELIKLRRVKDSEAAADGEGPSTEDADVRRRSTTNINQSVMESVAETLKGKTYSQLAALDKQIEPKMAGGEGVDVTYWETLSQFVRSQMARTRLRDLHQDNLRRKLEHLRQSQGILPQQPLFPSVTIEPTPMASSSSIIQDNAEPLRVERKKRAPSPEDDPVKTGKIEDRHSTEAIKSAREAQLETASKMEEEPYNSQLYSPARINPTSLEPDLVIYKPEDDLAKIGFQRQDILRTGALRASEEEELIHRSREGMEDGEDAQFSVTIPLEEQSFLWSDKYRPRKPRFFNRVHTGFVWNKYNQTHYDLDNPPPKIVQGYKFNIFYPDLIDKTVTPTYTHVPCPGDKDFATLRFSAGPPYEDIAFKIVNREWECSYKHGFRCQFHNNIFQLWFHFKRFRYRR